MNINKLLKNIAIGTLSTLSALYILFLVLPFILSPIVKNYIPTINDEIKKSTGLISSIEGIKFVTTPKLTMGAKVGKFILSTPDKKEIFNADDFQIKMSLLPIFAKRIEVDVVSLNNLNANLGLNKDGSLEIEKYFPAQTEPLPVENEQTEISTLPFGLKLSNRLPDIKIGGYNIVFTDISNGKEYVIKGNKTELTDFIFNKGFKLLAGGNMTLAGREQFKYNVKLNNKIMPDMDLNELIFNPELQKDKEKKKNEQDVKINILDILKGIYDYKITTNLDSDLVLTKDSYKGYLNAENVSVSPMGTTLPPSNIKLNFNGNKIDIDSNIYTAQNEASKITGSVKTGKNTNIDINFKSDAELANLVKIVNAFAMTFNIKDLQTLTANGKIDAKFNIKSDMKTVNSDGYLKIPSARIRYGLYNITVDRINADIALDNNNINIKNLGFVIFEQPLKLIGIIKQDATADLHLTANNLSLKGLIVACGQAALLKENPVNSGLVSLKADIKGKLDSIKPTAKIVLSNLDIKNIPSNTVLKLPLTNIDIITDGQTFSGNAVSTNIKAINPAATVVIPKLNANIKEDVIEIPQTPVKVEKINFNTSGKIKNYLTEKITLDFITSGDIKSKLTGDMNTIKQTLNLNYATTQNSTIIVPMFDKSKMIFNCNLGITGNMANPQVSGSVNVPSINLPEIPVSIEGLTAKLHGDILNGNASVAKFTSGGIIANSITTDFSMKGENFYLKNMKGNAFNGKFNGDITYNMTNTKTIVDLKGDGMDAEKAIEGAAGIKGALSGTLGFDAKVNLFVYPNYNDMMKSLKGNLSFRIDKGAFGKIGRLENLLQANNIIGNTVFKTTVASFSNVAAIKNSAQFDYLSGEMSFLNGWANIANIKSTGKSIAYFVAGKYNLINGTANVEILGRLDGAIVKLLGPIGELSAEKILSYIPKLGELTTKYAELLTTDPDRERTKDIPALSTGTDVYKDFKVVFNGGVESTSSVKSFKWLSKADTSGINQSSITDTIKSLKTNLNTDIGSTVNTVKEVQENIKTQQKQQKEQLKQSITDLKNLFKPQTSTSTETTTDTGKSANTSASSNTSNTTSATTSANTSTATSSATTENVNTPAANSAANSESVTNSAATSNSTTTETEKSVSNEAESKTQSEPATAENSEK